MNYPIFKPGYRYHFLIYCKREIYRSGVLRSGFHWIYSLFLPPTLKTTPIEAVSSLH